LVFITLIISSAYLEIFEPDLIPLNPIFLLFII
jgi:hypothetical protein